MNLKSILVVVGVIIAVAGLLIFTSPKDKQTSDPSQHTTGTGNLVLVEYGDFQCPACSQYAPVLEQIKQEYADLITFQFRHFPLESIHPNARAASRAAEAASLQGKFWEMHDHLFKYQSEWQTTGDPLSYFERYASTIGIEDTDKFKTDYRSSEVNSVINADLKAGRDIGVGGTPSFTLDGKLIDPTPNATYESFKVLLDSALGIESDETEDNQPADSSVDAKPEEDQ